MDGYLALLVGQDVPHAKPYTPSAAELKVWRDRQTRWASEAQRGLDVKQCLSAVRGGLAPWNPS